jgi:YD repeat-containing protein
MASLRFGNGLVATFAYDQDYRLTGLDTTDGTTAVQDLAYTYGDVDGDAGNIRAIDDNLDSSLDQAFDYDDVYRLTDADGVYGTVEYAWDAVGNRTSRAITVGSTVTETLTYDTGSNRLLTVADGSTTRTLTYTSNGHVTTDSRGLGFDYNYNHADRVATIEENAATIATYTYNDLGERVIKDLGGGDIAHFVFDLGGILIAEGDENATMAREYIHVAGLPVAIIDAGTSGTPTGIEIDNDDADASSTGTWDSATEGSGYAGGDYARRAGGDGSYAFIWTPTLGTANEYQVYARWPAWPGRASTATYTVHHAGGVTVDQRDGGGDWHLLGTFIMQPSQNHRVVLSDEADEPSTHDIVIDNNHPYATDSGHWNTQTDTTNGRFVGYNYQHQNAASTSAKFTWPAEIPQRGHYRVYARWSEGPIMRFTRTTRSTTSAVRARLRSISAGAAYCGHRSAPTSSRRVLTPWSSCPVTTAMAGLPPTPSASSV